MRRGVDQRGVDRTQDMREQVALGREDATVTGVEITAFACQLADGVPARSQRHTLRHRRLTDQPRHCRRPGFDRERLQNADAPCGACLEVSEKLSELGIGLLHLGRKMGQQVALQYPHSLMQGAQVDEFVVELAPQQHQQTRAPGIIHKALPRW